MWPVTVNARRCKGIVKLDVDEKELPKLQYVYETEEDMEEDPLDEDDAFEQLPS